MTAWPRWRAAAAAVLACGLLQAVPAAAQAGAEHVQVALPGDTLIGLGRRLLAEPRRWRDVARLNRLADPNRIPVGARLRFPLAWMRTEPRPATLLGSVGTLQAPARLDEGSELVTGADGHATVRLVDGTLLRLRPGSRLSLSESRVVPGTPVARARARLGGGRVEVEAAPAADGAPGFHIQTPQGVLGVRGTRFRVASEGDGAAARTRGEVIEGVVAVAGPDPAQGRKTDAGQRVSAGFGTVVDVDGRVALPVPLLPPPDLGRLPRLHERVLVRIPMPVTPGVSAWRAQVARDAAFDRVLADLRVAGHELRIAELPDGDYRLRVRGIDALGLEGRDSDLAFRLKARPEPPLPAAPAPGARSFGGRVEFAWAANADAGSYRLQLATEPSFAAPLRELEDLRAPAAVLEGLPPGQYHWRLRSVRPDGDLGPWGDPGHFELRPQPPLPPRPAVGERSVRFDWQGLPGQVFDFQVASDERFATLVFERRQAQTAIEIERPSSGRFWVRLRAIDPDGFVGPFGGAQYFDVPNCLRDAAGDCVRSAGEPVVMPR